LEQTKGSRLLADPHITVVDRHLATFEAKTRIPIQQLTQTQQGGAIGSTTFVDAGISLTVTPRIANDGTIEMQLTPVFSTLVGFDREGKPIIDERNASTVVRVNHGQALAIGGLRRKNTVESVKGIPGLMNIKYLGALFRTHDTDVRESELLVFIMPEIVGYCGGLPREMAALQVSQQQLSRVATAVDGPFTPDCKDKHCPHHNERPKIHNGMVDNGLIGSHDMIFVDPQAACLFPNCPSPSDTQSPSPTSSSPISIVPAPSRPEPEPEVPTVQFQELPPALPTATPVKTQLPVGVAASKTAASNTAAQRGEPSRFQAQSSSRRVPARSASFKR
jgi:general secretion pathway protein D